ncbi:MAG: hypothetical protein methR_P3072 [Methyloprofundus sp.]|nr:MAG: hypothetical protein methR_P3072 [Methyloprofundus sp.]
MLNKTLIGSMLIALSTATSAAPVDLSSWLENGSGTWAVAGDNNSVFQSINTPDPAVFFNNSNSQGLALSGQITVETTGDNDFIGFVLGYNDGDSSNASADYLLIDWKQGDQSPAVDGLTISQVSGAFNGADFWAHTGVVTELQRATNLSSTGWNDNQTYDFDLIFTATNVQVSVDGVTELNINGTFANGSFGFYNYSQSAVRYAGIEQDIAPPTQAPAPETFLLLLAGLSAMRYSHLRNQKV